MKIDMFALGEKFVEDEGSQVLTVRYGNQGEPFREGLVLSLFDENSYQGSQLFLRESEGRRLRDALIRLFPL